MSKLILRCISVLALVTAATTARPADRAGNARVLSKAASPMTAAGDCAARMQKLDQSQAEGEDRLREKYAVADFCASQYKNDKAVESLVKECDKYEEQPVVKQQYLADCMLAAYGYANALSALKAEYGKQRR